MDRVQVRDGVVRILSEHILLSEFDRGIDISEDDRLEIYGMDSFILIQIIVKIEQEFNIEIPSDLLQFERWGTINQIVECILEIQGK